MYETSNLGFKVPEYHDPVDNPFYYKESLEKLDQLLPKKADLNDAGKVLESQLDIDWSQVDESCFFQLGILLRERKAAGKPVLKNRGRYLDPLKVSNGVAIEKGSFSDGKILA